MVSVVTGRVIWFGNNVLYASDFCMVSVVTGHVIWFGNYVLLHIERQKKKKK